MQKNILPKSPQNKIREKSLIAKIVAVIFIIFLLISLLSYNQHDPSFLNTKQQNYDSINNLSGKLGANISAFFLGSFGAFPSFIIFLYLFLIIFYIAPKEINKMIIIVRFCLFLPFLLIFCTLMSDIVLKDITDIEVYENPNLISQAGGFIGYYLNTSLRYQLNNIEVQNKLLDPFIYFSLYFFCFISGTNSCGLSIINILKKIAALTINFFQAKTKQENFIQHHNNKYYHQDSNSFFIDNGKSDINVDSQTISHKINLSPQNHNILVNHYDKERRFDYEVEDSPRYRLPDHNDFSPEDANKSYQINNFNNTQQQYSQKEPTPQQNFQHQDSYHHTINSNFVPEKKNTGASSQYFSQQNYSAPQGSYQPLPSYLLTQPDLSKQKKISDENPELLQQMTEELAQVLQDFGIKGNIGEIHPGPVVTLCEFIPAPGIKSSRIISLADDIARSMFTKSARIAVIPGKNAIGIELPNRQRQFIYLREIIEDKIYNSNSSSLPLILGKNIGGETIIADLAKMPHLLVAGTTGSGKSVAINTMILSLLYKYSPEQCRMIMIDPKMLELSVYEGIPHLITPVVTNPKKAINVLKWAVSEMESRYRAMSVLGVRNIGGYNNIMNNSKEEKISKVIQTGFDPQTKQPQFASIDIENKPFPYIVIIVDEMADLMLVAGKEIEGYIQRLAQMARAAGIHLIMATQRPSVDVITGVIKANFPTRISFQVSSKIDSRTILGEMGAEQLLGMGDMLYMMPGGQIERAHGPFVDDADVEKVVNFLRAQGAPNYVDILFNIESVDVAPEDELGSVANDSDESLYQKAVEIIRRDKRISTSYIQRCLRIGYNRAALLIEKMEEEGIISSPNHAGKREIL